MYDRKEICFAILDVMAIQPNGFISLTNLLFMRFEYHLYRAPFVVHLKKTIIFAAYISGPK